MKVSFSRSIHFVIVFLLCLNINYPSQAQDQPPGGQVDLPPNLETAIRGFAETQNISIEIISVQKSSTQSFDEYCVILEPALYHAGFRESSNYWVLADQGFIVTHVPSNEEGFRTIGCNPGNTTIEVANPEQCPDLPMRLMYGEMGRAVINGSGPSNIRPFPGSPNPLLQIQEGQVFRVIQSPADSQYASPYCLLAGDGTPNRWWLIDVDGLGQGWVVEPWMQPDVVVPVDNSLTAPLIGSWVYYVETGMSELPEILHSSITFENNGMFSSVEQRVCGWSGNYEVIAIDTIRFDARGACEGGDEVSSVYDLKFSLSGDELILVSADGSPIVYEREGENTEIVEEDLSQPELTIVSETPIFQAPSINSPIVGNASIGTTYEVIGKNANSLWAQIRLNEELGWVCRETTTDNRLFFIVPINQQFQESTENCRGEILFSVDATYHDLEQTIDSRANTQLSASVFSENAQFAVQGVSNAYHQAALNYINQNPVGLSVQIIDDFAFIREADASTNYFNIACFVVDKFTGQGDTRIDGMDFVCVWFTAVFSSNPFFAGAQILAQPETYIDVWLDPVHNYIGRRPISCYVAKVMDLAVPDCP